MTSVRSLPNEILHHILDLVHPRDFENFAQICKATYLSSKPKLEKHRQLIRQYRTLFIHRPSEVLPNQPKDGFLSGVVPSVVQNLISNPRLGSYVRELKVGRSIGGSDLTYLHHVVNMTAEAVKKHEIRLERLYGDVTPWEVLQAKDSLSTTLDHWVINDSGQDGLGDVGLVVALLLPVVANLKVLTIEWSTDDDRLMLYLLQEAPFVTFRNLTTVHLSPGHLRGDTYGTPFENVTVISTLPFLRLLSADEAFDDLDWQYYEECKESHVPRLVLNRSRVNTKSLYEWLSRYNKLEEFSYEYRMPCYQDDDVYYAGDHWDPFLLRLGLLARSQSSLRRLSIFDTRREGSYIGSLKDFQALEEIHMDWRLIFPIHVNFEVWIPMQMPSSLRILRVRESRRVVDPGFIFELIDSLIHEKAKELPHLQVVDLLEFSPSYLLQTDAEELIQDCAKAEIALSIHWQEGE